MHGDGGDGCRHGVVLSLVGRVGGEFGAEHDLVLPLEATLQPGGAGASGGGAGGIHTLVPSPNNQYLSPVTFPNTTHGSPYFGKKQEKPCFIIIYVLLLSYSALVSCIASKSIISLSVAFFHKFVKF